VIFGYISGSKVQVKIKSILLFSALLRPSDFIGATYIGKKDKLQMVQVWQLGWWEVWKSVASRYKTWSEASLNVSIMSFYFLLIWYPGPTDPGEILALATLGDNIVFLPDCTLFKCKSTNPELLPQPPIISLL
jgi:hypothetical protein